MYNINRGEGVVGIIEQEDREESRYGRDKSTAIDKNYINSGYYRRKFDTLTADKDLNRTIYQYAKIILEHRSGTDFEDMYWFDFDTGKEFAAITDMTVPSRVVYSENYMDKYSHITNKITIHNHPRSMPPSIGDYESAYRNGYNLGVVVCHDGKVYVYKNITEPKKDVYDSIINQFLMLGYTEHTSSLKTLEYLASNQILLFKEVK
jgi:hypothetical protein